MTNLYCAANLLPVPQGWPLKGGSTVFCFKKGLRSILSAYPLRNRLCIGASGFLNAKAKSLVLTGDTILSQHLTS